MNRDIAIYALIAGLTTLAGAQDPLTWRTGVAVVLAALIAAKAKMSPGKPVDAPADLPGLTTIPLTDEQKAGLSANGARLPNANQ